MPKIMDAKRALRRGVILRELSGDREFSATAGPIQLDLRIACYSSH
jgi:hypothetical protein